MKRNHSNQLLEKWVEEANEKKEKWRKNMSASRPRTLFLKGPQEGLPALGPIKWVMALRGLAQLLTRGFTQPELLWLYKQDLQTFPCCKRAGNKNSPVSSWWFSVVLFWCVFWMLGLYFLLRGQLLPVSLRWLAGVSLGSSAL